jgi:sigma-B regulation protein RsbU (phosphoserine phosphatase)
MHEPSPSRNLTLLNEALLRQGSAARFCTAAYARLDRENSRLTVSSGGHPLPLLLRADGSVEPLGQPGLLLGLDPDPELTDHTRELRAGEAIVLYTDGLTDAYAPGRILEIDDLASLLASCAGRSAAEIADHILDAALNGHTAQPRDDIAVLVIRITTDGAARAAHGSATRTPASVTGHGGT